MLFNKKKRSSSTSNQSPQGATTTSKPRNTNMTKQTKSRTSPTSSPTSGSGAANMIQPPSKYVCPLTLDIMEHPVMSRYGHNFEQSAIMEWLCSTATDNNIAFASNDDDKDDNAISSRTGCCPLTRKPLKPSLLISNTGLRNEIQDWKQRNGYATVPEEFICPISKKIMKNPLLSKYGDHFDRDSILLWFNNHTRSSHICPVSGLPLKPRQLVSDLVLQQRIEQWKINHKYWDKEDDDEDGEINDLSSRSCEESSSPSTSCFILEEDDYVDGRPGKFLSCLLSSTGSFGRTSPVGNDGGPQSPIRTNQVVAMGA